MTNPRLMGDILRLHRQRSGLTQAQVAEDIGKSRATYCAWERGHVLPGRDSVQALACLFRVSTDVLLPSGTNHGDGVSRAITEDEALLLLCYRSLPKAEAHAHLELLRARLRVVR